MPRASPHNRVQMKERRERWKISALISCCTLSTACSAQCLVSSLVISGVNPIPLIDPIGDHSIAQSKLQSN